jgi:energy-coupling factor transporter transmembrane protein EcfT
VSDDFLRLFAFRTGLPCGYLIFFLFGAFWCFAATVVFIIGIIRRRVLLIAVPAMFLLLAATFVVGNVLYERALNLNPSVTEGGLAGTWKTPHSTLILRPDGSYQLRVGEDVARDFGTSFSAGRWQAESFGVRLLDGSGKPFSKLRAITFRGKLHLILDFEDPDAWDGDLGFARPPS